MPNTMSKIPASDSRRAPKVENSSIPKNTASRPSATEVVTCPRPHASVSRVVRAVDHPCALASAAIGIQWSGAREWSEATVTAAIASGTKSCSDMVGLVIMMVMMDVATGIVVIRAGTRRAPCRQPGQPLLDTQAGVGGERDHTIGGHHP